LQPTLWPLAAILTDKTLEVQSFSEGLAQVLTEGTYHTVGRMYGKWQYVDKTGKLPFALSWAYVSYPFKGGFAVVNCIEKKGVIDKTGKWAIRPGYYDIEMVEGGLFRGDKKEYIDSTGKVIWKPTP
jgi:hypothetical protein